MGFRFGSRMLKRSSLRLFDSKDTPELFEGQAEQFRMAFAKRARTNLAPSLIYDKSSQSLLSFAPRRKEPSQQSIPPPALADSESDQDEMAQFVHAPSDSTDSRWEGGLAFSFNIFAKRVGRGRGRGRGGRGTADSTLTSGGDPSASSSRDPLAAAGSEGPCIISEEGRPTRVVHYRFVSFATQASTQLEI